MGELGEGVGDLSLAQIFADARGIVRLYRPSLPLLKSV